MAQLVSVTVTGYSIRPLAHAFIPRLEERSDEFIVGSAGVLLRNLAWYLGAGILSDVRPLRYRKEEKKMYTLKVYLGTREPQIFEVEGAADIDKVFEGLKVQENAFVPVVSMMRKQATTAAGNGHNLLVDGANVTFSLPFGKALYFDAYEKIFNAYRVAGIELLGSSVERLEPGRGSGVVLGALADHLVQEIVTVINMPGAYGAIRDVQKAEERNLKS